MPAVSLVHSNTMHHHGSHCRADGPDMAQVRLEAAETQSTMVRATINCHAGMINTFYDIMFIAPHPPPPHPLRLYSRAAVADRAAVGGAEGHQGGPCRARHPRGRADALVVSCPQPCPVPLPVRVSTNLASGPPSRRRASSQQPVGASGPCQGCLNTT